MAKKIYLVWKDASCNGIEPEWIFMDGRCFYSFIKKPENKGRYFMTLDDRICNDADIVTVECTRERYKAWRVQKNHERYLDRCAESRSTVSISEVFNESEDLTYEEVLADDADFEEDLIRVAKNKLLNEFFDTLSDKDKDLLDLLYIKNKDKPESAIAIEIGVPQQTLNNRKLVLRKKLQKFLGKNGF
jgi:DNA-directed RNA polymerase specialized sigma subunit